MTVRRVSIQLESSFPPEIGESQHHSLSRVWVWLKLEEVREIYQTR